MDCPPIHYCRTADDVSIAYWTLGEGPPVLYILSPGVNHLTYEWALPPARRFYQNVSRRLRLIRYNPRRSGLSGQADDVSLDAFRSDVTAVLDATGADRVSLIGGHSGGSLAAAFAAAHPERIQSLLLTQAAVHHERMSALVQGLDRSFDSWTDLFAPGATAEEQHRFAQLAEHSISDLSWVKDAQIAWDVEHILAAVRAPTLVIDWPDAMLPEGPELASAIPGARLVTRSGRSGGGWWDPDPEGLHALIETFILEHAEQPAAPPSAAPEPATARRASAPRLTPREVEVLRLIADGASNPEIAETLVISPGTVARHVTNILNKTGCKNRTDAARYAADHGLTRD